MLIFDAHLDLSMNALEWNRDLARPIEEIRQREFNLTDKKDRGKGTVCLPEMRRGGIGICVATQIARYVKPENPLQGWHSPAQAWAQTQGQLSWYRAMEDAGQMVQIKDSAGLNSHVELWLNALESKKEKPVERSESDGSESSIPTQSSEDLPIGYILSLEGADSIVNLSYLERSYSQGLRALGPAHYGPGTYAQGTHAAGGLGARGCELLNEMDRLGIILDATHLCDESFWEALDCFSGPVWASHSNCRALVPHERQFTDDQLKALIERGAVIGAVLDAWMMAPGWIKNKTTPESAGLKLERIVEHIDHVCQLAGNTLHSGIGTDLDGGFGREQSPGDLDTIAGIARISEMLKSRGYPDEGIQQIMHENFIRFLNTAWK